MQINYTDRKIRTQRLIVALLFSIIFLTSKKEDDIANFAKL